MKNKHAHLYLPILLLAQGIHAAQANTETNDLTNLLIEKLQVSRSQAEGGAGALLAAAEKALSTEQFSQLASTIPATEQLLNSIPSLDESGYINSRFDEYGIQPHTQKLVSQFQQLGLPPGYIKHFNQVIYNCLKESHSPALALVLDKSLKDL